MSVEISRFSSAAVQEFPLRGAAAMLYAREAQLSQPLPQSQVEQQKPSSCSLLQPLPDDIVRIINDYSSETHLRNYDSKAEMDGELCQVFEPTVLFPGGKTVGSFDRHIVSLRADDAIRDTLYRVDGYIDRLDSQSRERIRELRPYVRHLNLSFMYINANKIVQIIYDLLSNGVEKNRGTRIESLTLSYQGIDDSTLRAIANLNKKGFFSQLKAFTIETYALRDTTHRGHFFGKITPKGLHALLESGFFDRLEVVELPQQLDCSDELHTRVLQKRLEACKSLKKFRDVRYLDPKKMLKQLQIFTIDGYTGNFSFSEGLHVLGNADMHLQHLEINTRGIECCITGRRYDVDNLLPDLLQKVMKKVDTLSFNVYHISADQVRLFASQSTDEDLAKVTRLGLLSCRFNNEMLQAISESMPHLVTLSLQDCVIDEEGLDFTLLRRFEKLREFQCTSFSKPNVMYLERRSTFCTFHQPLLKKMIEMMPKLEKLAIDVDDMQDIKSIPQLQGLQALVAYGPRQSASDLSYIVRTLNQVQLEELFTAS